MAKHKPKLLYIPFYNLNNEKVCELYEGDLEFKNEFCLKGSYYPYAIFYNKSPNREKGHKDYLCFTQTKDTHGATRLVFTGLDKDEMLKYQYQDALFCHHCNTIVYSQYRHDMQYCRCNNLDKYCAIDGGADYTKVTYGQNASYEMVRLDLINYTFESKGNKTMSCKPFTPKKYKLLKGD